MAGRFLVAALLSPLALAFLDTVPLLAWSSQRSTTLDRLPSNARDVQGLLDQILVSDDICNFDAIVLVDQPGLHASDLRTLPPSSALAQILTSSPSQRQFQYLSTPPSNSLSTLAQTLATQCNAPLIFLTPGSSFSHDDTKNVISIALPSLQDQIGGTRKDRMAAYAAQLSDELAYIAASFPAHLVLYTSSSHAEPLFADQHHTFEARNAHVYANTTLPEGGILKRYQLLTPGLILSLLVSFFLLVPIVHFGFKALASIQSPLRVESPKRYSAADKKAQ